MSPAILRILLSFMHRAFSSFELWADPFISPGILVVSKKIRKMTKPGDPDLYVQFDQNPDPNAYHCWPYPSGAKENSSLEVPANVTAAHVRVRGYSPAHYSLTVTHTPPTH
jgi:hypothetical protein